MVADMSRLAAIAFDPDAHPGARHPYQVRLTLRRRADP
jgi:hypothetical protein